MRSLGQLFKTDRTDIILSADFITHGLKGDMTQLRLQKEPRIS